MAKRKTQDELELSQTQILLGIHMRELGLRPWFEHKFCEDRYFRFDVCDKELRIAAEISGGNWSGGHRRGKAQEDEYDKLNTATMMGWRVFQWTNAQVSDGRAKAFLAEWLDTQSKRATHQ